MIPVLKVIQNSQYVKSVLVIPLVTLQVHPAVHPPLPVNVSQGTLVKTVFHAIATIGSSNHPTVKHAIVMSMELKAEGVMS